jgi:nucleotide-binding universal stress UspA family protein
MEEKRRKKNPPAGGKVADFIYFKALGGLAFRLPMIFPFNEKGEKTMILIKKILVPLDLSDISLCAVGYATCLAKQTQAEILALHVLNVDVLKPNVAGTYSDQFTVGAQGPIATRAFDSENIMESKRRIVQAFLDQKLSSELRSGVRLQPVVRLGKVADEIIASAKEEHCDLIVMMSLSGRLRRLFGGSIAERVIRHATCPVLSMKTSAHVRTEKDEQLEVGAIDRWAA